MLDTKNPIYRITVMGEEIPIVPSDFVIPEPTPPTPEEPDTDYDQNYSTILHTLSTPVNENGWASSAAVVEAISAVFDENIFNGGHMSGSNPMNTILDQWQNGDKNTFESLGFVLETFRHQTNVTLEDGTTRFVNIYDTKDLTTPLTVRNVGYVLNGQIVDYETLYNRSDWVMFLSTTVVIKNTDNTVDIYLYIYALESGVYTSADGLITLNLDNDTNTSTTNFSNMNEYAGQVFSFSLYPGLIYEPETNEEYLGASAYVYDNNLGSLEFKFKLTGFNQLSYKGTPLTKTGDLQVATPVPFSWDIDSSKFASYGVTDPQTGIEVIEVTPGRTYNVYFATHAGFYAESLTIDGVQQAFWEAGGISSTTVSFTAPSNNFTIGLYLVASTGQTTFNSFSSTNLNSMELAEPYEEEPGAWVHLASDNLNSVPLNVGQEYRVDMEVSAGYAITNILYNGSSIWSGNHTNNDGLLFIQFYAADNAVFDVITEQVGVSFSWGTMDAAKLMRWQVIDPETGNQVYASLTPGKTYNIVLMANTVNGYFLEAVTINGVQQAHWTESAADATISFTAPSDDFTIEVQVATRNTFTYNAENFSTFELHESYIDTEMGGGTSYRLFADSNFDTTALTVGKEYAIKMAPNSSVAITEVYYNDTLLWSGMHNDLGVELLITFVATTNGTFRVVTQLTPTTTTNTFNYTQADLSDIELHEPYEEEPGSWSHLAEGAALNSTQLTIGTEYRMMLIANTNSVITQVSYNGNSLWSGTHTNSDGNLFVTFTAVENGVFQVTTEDAPITYTPTYDENAVESIAIVDVSSGATVTELEANHQYRVDVTTNEGHELRLITMNGTQIYKYDPWNNSVSGGGRFTCPDSSFTLEITTVAAVDVNIDYDETAIETVTFSRRTGTSNPITPSAYYYPDETYNLIVIPKTGNAVTEILINGEQKLTFDPATGTGSNSANTVKLATDTTISITTTAIENVASINFVYTEKENPHPNGLVEAKFSYRDSNIPIHNLNNIVPGVWLWVSITTGFDNNSVTYFATSLTLDGTETNSSGMNTRNVSAQLTLNEAKTYTLALEMVPELTYTTENISDAGTEDLESISVTNISGSTVSEYKPNTQYKVVATPKSGYYVLKIVVDDTEIYTYNPDTGEASGDCTFTTGTTPFHVQVYTSH